MHFVERLNQVMKDKGVTANKIANAIGVSPQTAKRWEKGENVPYGEKLSKLASYFGVSVDWLMCKDGDNEKVEDLSESEQWFLDKFRELDEDGVVAVRGCLLDEWRRCCLARGEGQNKESSGSVAQ